MPAALCRRERSSQGQEQEMFSRIPPHAGSGVTRCVGVIAARSKLQIRRNRSSSATTLPRTIGLALLGTPETSITMKQSTMRTQENWTHRSKSHRQQAHAEGLSDIGWSASDKTTEINDAYLHQV